MNFREPSGAARLSYLPLSLDLVFRQQWARFVIAQSQWRRSELPGLTVGDDSISAVLNSGGQRQ
jgi:hypothetical protein